MEYWDIGILEHWVFERITPTLHSFHYSSLFPKENPSAGGGGVVGWEDKLGGYFGVTAANMLFCPRCTSRRILFWSLACSSFCTRSSTSLDRFTVDLADDVAGLNSRIGCWTPRFNAGHYHARFTF